MKDMCGYVWFVKGSGELHLRQDYLTEQLCSECIFAINKLASVSSFMLVLVESR